MSATPIDATVEPPSVWTAPARLQPLHARILKRCLDIVVAVVVLTVTAPIILVAAIAIRLDSPGPAFFRQERMGWRGRSFSLLKLRGMLVDAEARFPDLYDYERLGRTRPDHCYFHPEDDPRITRVGRLTRKYSIDELPNFWNVLQGDMSVVGPRPDIPELANLYGEDLERILSVRPGVTSPAKAYGRDALCFQDTLISDLDYISRQSLALDLITILRTLKSVVRANGVR